MITSIVRVMAYAGICLMILGQFSCAPATITMPARYLTPETSTPTVVTLAPTGPPMPVATVTSTPTAIATLTPTATPAGTPTHLPDLGTPVPGTGDVTGLVLWNGQPVPHAAVWLCEEFQGSCKGQENWRVNTNDQGYYGIKQVRPGRYIVAINSFNTGWFVFYVDKNGGREQTVSANETLILDPFNIWKFNLASITPRSGRLITEAKPTFTWETYPGSAYYQISIYDAQSRPVVEGQQVEGLSFTPADPLVACKYSWEVNAFNEQGIKIASTNPRNTIFTVTNVPGEC